MNEARKTSRLYETNAQATRRRKAPQRPDAAPETPIVQHRIATPRRRRIAPWVTYVVFVIVVTIVVVVVFFRTGAL